MDRKLVMIEHTVSQFRFQKLARQEKLTEKTDFIITALEETPASAVLAITTRTAVGCFGTVKAGSLPKKCSGYKECLNQQSLVHLDRAASLHAQGALRGQLLTTSRVRGAFNSLS